MASEMTSEPKRVIMRFRVHRGAFDFECSTNGTHTASNLFELFIRTDEFEAHQ
jgi:hypothetical protein